MLEKGVAVDKDLFARKSHSVLDPDRLISKEEYERDLERLTGRVIPYSQVKRDVERGLGVLRP